MAKDVLRPGGRFKAAGETWRVRAAKGPLYDGRRRACMCRIDWFTRRLVYDETLDRNPIVLAQLIAVAVGAIWDGEVKAATGGRPLEQCIDLAVQLN